MSRVGNAAASIIVTMALLAGIILYANQFSDLAITPQDDRDLFTQATTILDNAFRQSIAASFEEGFRTNQTAWYCNAPIPPNTSEIDRSFDANAKAAIQRLKSQLQQSGLNVTNPTIQYLNNTTKQTTTFNVTNLSITRSFEGGNETLLLDDLYSYGYDINAFIDAYTTWLNCSGPGLQSDIQTQIQPPKQCLYENCCCGGTTNVNQAINQLRADRDHTVTKQQVEQAITPSLQSLQNLFNGAETCNGPPINPSTGIQCELSVVTTQATSNTQITETMDACTMGYSCDFKPVGTSNPPYVDITTLNTLCPANIPGGVTLGPNYDFSDGTAPHSPGDVLGTRIAFHDRAAFVANITCVDTNNVIPTPSGLKPLRSTIEIVYAGEQICNVSQSTGGSTVDFSGYSCFPDASDPGDDTGGGGGPSGGTGPRCVNPHVPCPQTNVCNDAGEVLRPIRDADGDLVLDPNGQPQCQYEPCDSVFLCPYKAECCDGTFHDLTIECVGNQGCVSLEDPNAICDAHEATLPDSDGDGLPDACESTGTGPGGGDDGGGDGDGSDGGDGDGDDSGDDDSGDDTDNPTCTVGFPCSGSTGNACTYLECVDVAGTPTCQETPVPEGDKGGCGDVGDSCTTLTCQDDGSGTLTCQEDTKAVGERCGGSTGNQCTQNQCQDVSGSIQCTEVDLGAVSCNGAHDECTDYQCVSGTCTAVSDSSGSSCGGSPDILNGGCIKQYKECVPTGTPNEAECQVTSTDTSAIDCNYNGCGGVTYTGSCTTSNQCVLGDGDGCPSGEQCCTDSTGGATCVIDSVNCNPSATT